MAISLPRSYPSLRRMLCCQYSHLEESWVIEWIRIRAGYVWAWKFLNPERKSCGFKNMRVRVDRASVSHSPQPLNRSTEDSYIQSLSRRKNIHSFQSEEDLCTTVYIVLNSNSGTFSQVFVNILLYMYAEANHVEMSPWRFSSAATTYSKLDYLFHRCG